ncbi:uncharacterized protein [Lolium perenne]|jgi:hypothetical protein|uniref:uncharacterized protein n=1 Tax=Lolium perenne TaxID=4522 RepID=UPI0021F69592|nr:uncharacterized protein LOC127316547 [Lolium perenne]
MKAKAKISMATELLRKALRALRGKASVLRARILFLASLRRRTAMVGVASRHLRVLMRGRQRDAVDDHRKALAPSTAAALEDEQVPPHGVDAASLSELFQEIVGDNDDGGYPDWTHSLFDDDDHQDGDVEDEQERGGGCEAVDVDEDRLADDEPSVMDVIRRRREGDGVEFNVDEEIDQAADMFIRRVRSRMNNRSF